MMFADLRLAEPILRALAAENYTKPTPIQAQAIPPIMEGRDVLGCAQTGTGKTAAFALPMLHRFSRKAPTSGQKRPIRALILSPTRELAVQIDESFRAYGQHLGLRHTVIFGGVSQHHQVQSLRNGTDIVVATPGRLLDLMNQGHVDLRHVEVFVLDEADRMLDMGFIHDIRRIIPKLPAKRQNLLFSATMPPDIRQLADSILRQPVNVTVTPVASTVDKVDQSVYMVDKRNKPYLLAHLLSNQAFSRALVFTRTKHGADRVVKQLHKAGITSEAIHGNKSQNARQRALSNFKTGKTPVLIASDIAARGIDIDDISHVINFDLSNEPETYVHRIGRTARAGASGTAVSFCDRDERSYLKAIERLIRKEIRVQADHPEYPAFDAAQRHAEAGDDRRRPQGHRRPQRDSSASAHPHHRSDRPQQLAHPHRQTRTQQQPNPTPPRAQGGGNGQRSSNRSPAPHPAARPLHGGWSRSTKPSPRRFR
ncbi:MAG TPA: DEAD/DEAH box helicase [Tepidisphaeraceae bacterium]|nr:DEAD/DEAH box helicase [Tepidisphaeraceae bacterium]